MRTISTPLQRWALAVCLAGTTILSASAAVVVNWGPSGDYVTGGPAFNLPTAGISGSTTIYTYSNSNAISPTTDYTPPVGMSGTFYGGSYLTASSGTAPLWTFARVQQATNGVDRIQYQISGGDTPTITYTGAAFTAFLQEDFLNGGSTDTVRLTPDGTTPGGSLYLSATNASGALHRFAILNEGQWYLSELVSTQNQKELSLSGSAMLTSLWGAWNPIDGANNNQLSAVPVSFTTLGSSFTDIEGFGYYVGLSGINKNIVSAVSQFSIDATVIPEPSVAVLALGAGLALLLRRRRKPQPSEVSPPVSRYS